MERVDVLIVGAGPTGLTAANLCAAVGLSSIVIEQRDGPQRAPAAHAVNARSFEIWRQCGVPMEPLLAAARPPADAGWVHWVTRLGGEVLGSLPYERQGEEMLAVTPTPLRNLSQHTLEPLLTAPGLDVRYEHIWAGAEQGSDAVISRVTGPDGEHEITAHYLIGADGAGSPVRRWLGIEPIGPRNIQSFVAIHVGADLRSLAGDHPGILYFVNQPPATGVLVAHDIDREWVYMYPWDPEAEPLDGFTDDRCLELVRSTLEEPDVELAILGRSTWHMTAQVAERYRDRRVFLVGDAAHRFPPTGGLGLNTGVADAHNLVWKLGAVEAGWAPPSLLDSYEQERRPVAQFNADQSLANAFKLVEVVEAMGLTSDAKASATALATRLADPAARAAIGDAIAAQATHFDLLGLQLGHTYPDGAVLPDGTPPMEVQDPARDYVPSTRPGGRLPHVWAEAGVSTLDLVDGRVPTVLHGPASTPRTVGPDVRVVACSPAVWVEGLGLGEHDALIVRPDQHIAFRGPLAEVDRALERLFPARTVSG